MTENDWLARKFEEHRGHLRAVAYRMLGSSGDADDAVQETWLRLSRSNTDEIDNFAGWLTTVLARVCLNMLRARTSRREEPLDERLVEPAAGAPAVSVKEPEGQALQADSVGVAMLVVLDQLTPAQRLAFVLHDLFGVPFEQIAPIVERSPAATRQLASRARRLVRGGGSGSADTVRQREVVDAFLAAARDGDFEALLRLLDPDIVLRADRVAVHAARNVDGAPLFAPEVHGVAAVAKVFSGRAAGAHAALIDGEIGAAWAPRGVPRSAFVMTIVGDKITAIDIVVERDALAELDVQILT